MGNGDTNLYTKEILEDLLSVIFLNLLRQPGQHFPKWIWLRFFTSIGQQFGGDPWRAHTRSKGHQQ